MPITSSCIFKSLNDHIVGTFAKKKNLISFHILQDTTLSFPRASELARIQELILFSTLWSINGNGLTRVHSYEFVTKLFCSID